jgi:hypothetical protein
LDLLVRFWLLTLLVFIGLHMSAQLVRRVKQVLKAQLALLDHAVLQDSLVQLLQLLVLLVLKDRKVLLVSLVRSARKVLKARLDSLVR